jgi:pimeloyl-ACP methyl ester carboxylesterase
MATVSAAYAISIVATVLIAGLFTSIYIRYRRDIREARERVSLGSSMAETPCGPIEYAVAGDGPPVLVVHGAGGGYDQGLDIVAPLVGDGYRVIAMSRFGYLRTPLPADASAVAQADAHACLLDALNIRRAVVFGASAGGPSAMQFALRHPERTVALVLMVPAAYAPRPMDVRSKRIPAAFEFLLEAVLKSDFLFWALIHFARQTAIRMILGTPPAVVQSVNAGERASVAHILNHILPVSPRRIGLLNDAAIVSSLPRYELERIAAPTLIMSAADDLYGTFDGSRYSAEHIPHARFIGYPSGGHMGVGHEKETMSEIAAFLKGVEGN